MQPLVVELLLLDPALVLLSKVVVVLEVLLGEDVEELREDGVRIAEGLHGGEGAEVLEVEAGGGRDGGSDGAEGELLCLFGCEFILVVAVEGLEGLDEVVVRLAVKGKCQYKSQVAEIGGSSRLVAGLVGGVRDLDKKLELVLLVGLPLLEPDVKVFQAGLEEVELVVLSEEADNLHKDIVPQRVLDLEKVEDCAEGA